jgi:hypothetical protein
MEEEIEKEKSVSGSSKKKRTERSLSEEIARILNGKKRNKE